MAVKVYHTRELDQYVAECDRLGGIAHPDAAQIRADFRLEYDTRPNQQLDPFSEEYYQQQVALYTELSGRKVDQEQGELTPLDVDTHAGGNNPYNSGDVGWIAKHTRAIHSCLVLANLPHKATILDAGSGWGLSSEAMAFCGASVTALDINPLFVQLVKKRAERLSLPIEAVQSEFDQFASTQQYDMLLFYECLHHSLKPWETLAHLGKFVKPDGKILFAGEPINTCWWKDWGIRLDPESVYVIRKFGWWEGGWSTDFISRCFSRAGFTLTPYAHTGLDNGMIGFACRHGAEATVKPNLKAWESVLGEINSSNFNLTERQAEITTLKQRHEQLVNQYELESVKLHGHIQGLQHAIADMRSSRSWRVTAPLRYFFNSLGVSRS